MTRRPTLLVFTLGAEAERARRPLLPAEHGRTEVELRRSCLDAAVRAGREAGCRVVVSAPGDVPRPDGTELQRQEGAGFGERLERACFAAAGGGDGAAGTAGADGPPVRGAGPSHGGRTASAGAWTGDAPPPGGEGSYGDGRPGATGAVEPGGAGRGGPLIVVGTDVPGLRARHLRRAAAALEADPGCVVLGPSPDGGFYLLATARPLPGLAAMTHWCRGDTLARLRRSLAAAGRRVVTLEPLRDLDHRRDLERWMAEGPTARPRTRRAARRRPGMGGGDDAPSPSRSTGDPAPRDLHPECPRSAGDPAPPGRDAPWSSLLGHLARLLASLRRPSPWAPPAPLRPVVVTGLSPRAPPRPFP